jgi:hypothetical protein
MYMPDFAILELEKVTCPNCNKLTGVPDGIVKFQWGKIPHNYRLGQKIVWLTDAEGNIRPAFNLIQKKWLFWSHFAYNCGEPRYADLFVFDSDPNFSGFLCSECGMNIDVLVLKIEGGVIKRVLALREHDFEPVLGLTVAKTDVLIIREDGSLWPRYDWEDAPLS